MLKLHFLKSKVIMIQIRKVGRNKFNDYNHEIFNKYWVETPQVNAKSSSFVGSGPNNNSFITNRV